MAVLDGLTVLDLSWGIAGPMTGMLLADNGARVIKIERPGGDPFRGLSGYRVWNRGKQSAVLDLRRDEDRAQLLTLAKGADVLLESFSPGTTARLGIDHAAVEAVNERLVYCSITAYGRDTRDAHRPGYDALVAARTGLQWEQRGWPGTNVDRLAGRPPRLGHLEVPDGCVEGAARDGPLFSYSAWPSLGAAFCASSAISAALLARETTGRGQWVETSLLQGVLAATAMTWQRVEDPDAPGLWGWMFDRRAPKGFFRCADGRWVQIWVQRPSFVIPAAEGERLRMPDGFATSRHDPDRLGTGEGDLAVLIHYQPLMAEAFAKFPAAQWVELAREANVALQMVRSPEEALDDPAFLADGCVSEVTDTELGRVRQVGAAYSLASCPPRISAGAPRVGEHTEAVLAEADRLATSPATIAARGRSLSAPLDGTRVLDLGFAVAGPFGTQVLADLGADVIKVNAFTDTWWHASHIALSCNRGKRSIAVNLKDPRGLAVFHRLVERADVVQHNMRPRAAARLGVDYESLRAVNSTLVYCHTRGFERAGSRVDSPGNDQTGAALTGVEWEDGAVGAGGRPFWSLTSFGDVGNGFLSAIAIMQALYHRARTGEGQMVDTSIVNACLLNASHAWMTVDGRGAQRPHLDAEQLGFGALYRLYRTAGGWLCLAVLTDDEWACLCDAIGPALGDDPRFANCDERATHDDALAAVLEQVLLEHPANKWHEILDAAGVPCEVSSPTFALGVFDDPELRERGWVVSYEQGRVGRMEQHGLLFDLSDTPGCVAGPPLTVGDHTLAILAEHGYDDTEVQALIDDKIVADNIGAPKRRDGVTPGADR